MSEPPRSLLSALVAPESVALIGASSTEGRVAARPLAFLRRHGFRGRILPVNPTRDTVMGLPAFRSVKSIPERVQHATILLDAEPAMTALEECAEAGVMVVSMLAGGFAEAGEEGRRRQDRLERIAREAGILLIGPNSTGVVGTAAGFACTTNAAFAADHLLKGRLAVLSQSGSVTGTILSRGQARGLGFSALVSVGNEAATGIGEIGDLLLDDPDTDAFLLFMETIRNREALARFAARAGRMEKPVVAYVIGRSDEGQALAVTHTGALTGSSRAVAGWLRTNGIVQVGSLETLIEAPPALARLARPTSRPRTATVVSTTGGGGAMVVDEISARGVAIAGCGGAARASLAAKGIALGSGKLVDVTMAGTNHATMKTVVSTLLADPATGVLVIVIGSSAQFNPELAVRPIVEAWREAPEGRASILAFSLPHAPESLRLLEEGGVPAFRTVESCAETVALLLARHPGFAMPPEALPARTTALIGKARAGVLDEATSGEILASLKLKLPRQVVLAPGTPVPSEMPFPFPVVAKVLSPDLPHKTEAGAVRVGIEDREQLAGTIAEMLASAERFRPDFERRGILVQEMCTGLGEALIGLTRDPLAGPVITVGMGGLLAEIYRDTSVRPAPVPLEVAREMLGEVKGFAALRAYRGRPPGDLEALAQAVSTLSRLAQSDLIEEAEINPALVRAEGAGIIVLDALIRRRRQEDKL